MSVDKLESHPETQPSDHNTHQGHRRLHVPLTALLIGMIPPPPGALLVELPLLMDFKFLYLFRDLF